MKTFVIFLLSKETFTIRTCSILASFFHKLLSKATFERKLSSVSLPSESLSGGYEGELLEVFCAILCMTVVYSDTHRREQFLKMSVGLGLGFCVFV